MPTRVLFVITDLYLGGSPRMLRDLAIGLKKYDVVPEVVSLKTFPPEGQKKGGGVVEELRAGGVEVRSLELASMWQLRQGARQLRKMIQTFNPKIVTSILVHANTLATLAMAGQRERPRLVHSIHTLQEKPAWHWTLTRIIARYADAIVAPSQTILDKITPYGRHKCAKVIPNGVNVRQFAEAKPLEKLPWPVGGGTRVIGYIGRFDPVKNLPLLLRGFAHIADDVTHLALVGYGPEEEPLKRLAQELKINNRVHFPGPTQEPERWYKSFNCHCLPSTAEGFGLTLAESIAAGAPVVAVRTPVTEAIVRHKIDGLLIDRPDEKLLVIAMQEVIQKTGPSPLRPTSAETGREYVEKHFSVEHMVEQYANFFKDF